MKNMKKLSIITGERNKILRSKAKRINFTKVDKEYLDNLLRSMEEVMKENRGVGLAAPQIGISERLFIVNTSSGIILFVNPTIYWKSLKRESEEEGCLSLPGKGGRVKRHKAIHLRYFDIHGQRHFLKAKGLLARVIQHENDHLNGVLFIDRLKK